MIGFTSRALKFDWSRLPWPCRETFNKKRTKITKFSPEDKYSQQRILIKKRFNLLPTQQPKPIY
uniref:Nucleolar protein 10 n=1 Tax=Romanomermis culicivorax TaxID=13658 RepID=A0A915K059_ROMCU